MNAEFVLRAQRAGKRALLLSGPIGSGKTSAVLSLSAELLGMGVALDGVASPRILKNGKTVGYWVRRLPSGEERLLCALEPPGLPLGRFFFRPEALEFANTVLVRAAKEAEVVAIDEVGPLELAGGGFFPGLQACLSSNAFLILTVRPHLVPSVQGWFGAKALEIRLPAR